MEKQGAAWGARREVIHRAISALHELFETVTTSGLTESEMEVDVRFDEFNINVDARYRGALPVLPAADPDVKDILESDEAAIRLSSFMITWYADSVKLDERDGICHVRLHFDH
jgi:NCS2 family nucleobase:cation symporter-2